MLILNPNEPDIKRPFVDSQSSDAEDEEDNDFLMVGMVVKHDAGTTSSWILDCESSTHVCVDKNLLSTMKKSTAMFKVWTGEVKKCHMSGTVLLNVNSGGSCMEVKLNDVEFLPAGYVNLVRIEKMESEG
ncbi:hypothetical protein GN958_ATG01283 [Phytophthora infestans]|nr:hypothetical protein GN958_ATG01283 [Phytophthora infestans]